MPRSPLDELADRLRDEAELFRRRGLDREADLEESLAEEVEEALRAHRREELTLKEAAAESGYSVKRLRELVRKGKIPDNRPDGSRGTIRVRRRDLPRKPAGDRDPEPSAVDSIAGRIQGGSA